MFQHESLEVDWRLFSLPVELGKRRRLPEHLDHVGRYQSSDSQENKAKFWCGLAMVKNGWITRDPNEKKRQCRHLRGMKPGFRFYAHDITQTRDYEVSTEYVPHQSRVEAFMRAALTEGLGDIDSYKAEIKSIKIPGSVFKCLNDIEPQFFLRNIARLEFALLYEKAHFEHHRVEYRGIERELDEIRRNKYHEPNLHMEWSVYTFLEIRAERRQFVYGHDWEDWFGVEDREALDEKRRKKLALYFGWQ